METTCEAVAMPSNWAKQHSVMGRLKFQDFIASQHRRKKDFECDHPDIALLVDEVMSWLEEDLRAEM